MNPSNIPSPPSSTPPLKFTLPSPLSLPPEPNPCNWRNTPPKARILVAEDDSVSREMICARLAKWGYEVQVATNGIDAMNALRSKDAPELAILDWMMPGMDGVEICRRVREAERLTNIIMLNAKADMGSVVEGLNSGANDYLAKPFNKEELQARILAGLRVIAQQANIANRIKADRIKKLDTASSENRDIRGRLAL